MADAIRTRCKFRVIGVEATEYEIGTKCITQKENPELFATLPDHGNPNYRIVHTGKFAENVRLAASYDTANPEDISFSEATPSGEVKIYVTNPVVIGTFKPGKNYYLDLIPCE